MAVEDVALAKDSPTSGAGFTQKEMLVRIDAKVDVIAAKQAHYDVELALLKARQDEYEKAELARDQTLETARVLMAQEIANIKRGQLKVSSLVKWTAGVLGGIIIIGDAVARFLN